MHETNGCILGNAAAFYTVHDSALTEALLKKAQALEPTNPDWCRRLGILYGLGLSRARR